MSECERVWLGQAVPERRRLRDTLYEMTRYLGVAVPSQGRVVIKPNFTWPGWKKGVTTHPELLAALAEFFVDHGNEVWFVESDGGMESWKAREAFEGHGLIKLAKQMGERVKCVALDTVPATYLSVWCWGKFSRIPIPEILVDPDVFYVTCPVLKTHCMTETSLAFKNQWGCVPDPYRLRFHHVIGKALVEMARRIPIRLVVVDGLIALDGNGPMFGDPVELGLLIGARSPGAASRVGCEVMGLKWWRSRVLRAARKYGLLPDMSNLELSEPIEGWRKRQFRTTRTIPNYAAIAIAYSRVLTWFFYLSPFRPWIARLKTKLFGANEITRNGQSCPY